MMATNSPFSQRKSLFPFQSLNHRISIFEGFLHIFKFNGTHFYPPIQ